MGKNDNIYDIYANKSRIEYNLENINNLEIGIFFVTFCSPVLDVMCYFANACARTFGVARDTLRSWELRFSSVKKSLYLYALCHDFLSQVIEGDELYTTLHHKTAASDSEGWTVVLMERASRFIWHMECGRRDKRLFKRAIKTLATIAKKTKQITLITDGEKRYGTTLFEVCSEVMRSGKRGRPKKLYPRACV
ncbi:MAG: hypothetical protein KA436_11320 [Oligoflexales bacterium]|nr:hypothetical protein [Oligoflexales bacterium]